MAKQVERFGTMTIKIIATQDGQELYRDTLELSTDPTRQENPMVVERNWERAFDEMLDAVGFDNWVPAIDDELEGASESTEA